MDRLLIRGGRQLSGDVKVSGAKNAALFAISILSDQDPKLKKRYSYWRSKQTKTVKKKPK